MQSFNPLSFTSAAYFRLRIFKSGFVLLLAIMCGSLTAQTIRERNDSVFQIVLKDINTKNSVHMYSMLDDAFQKAQSIEVVTKTNERELYPLATLTASFNKFYNGVNYYLIRSAKSPRILSMGIRVDKNAKVAALFFSPYKADNAKRNDSVFQAYHRLANSKDLDKMYAMVSGSFQTAVPMPKYTADWEKLVFPLGETKYELEFFDGYQSSYKMYSPKGALKMLIGLDSAGLINSSWISPYKKPAQDTIFTRKTR